MDEKLRNLERLAQIGDSEAQEQLKIMRQRLGLCKEHGLADCDDCNPEKLVWDTYENTKSYAEYLFTDSEKREEYREEHDGEELTEDKAFEMACEDDDLQRIEWEGFCNVLSEWLEEKNPEEYSWIVSARGVGWRRRSGRTTIRATNSAADWLREILPNGDNTFSIYKWKNRSYLQIVNSHHDAQGEVYYVEPEILYTLCEDPASWSVRKGDRIIIRPDFDDVMKALDILEERILEKWGDQVNIDFGRNCESIVRPKGVGSFGSPTVIAEIDKYLDDNWQKIITDITGKIEGYHDCDCCSETIIDQAMCDACIDAGCQGGDGACQVECAHSNFYIEGGVRICEDCGMGEDGSQH